MNHSPAEHANGGKIAAGGVLYVVATPIGNLADMVPRATETLQQVDIIAAEDTRHSKRLLEHFHISTPLLAYHDHNEQQSLPGILSRLGQGQKVALISDAGTPLVSDPGYRLVRAAREAGFAVVPIPGPSALIAALSVAGLPSDRFTFEGFLHAKSGQRRKQLENLQRESRTLIFYEAPHRILTCLRDLADVFGADREVVLARELTKTFETVLAGSAMEVADRVESDPNQQKGEIVLLVRGAESPETTEVDPEAQRVMAILQRDLSLKQAASLAAEITGAKKNALYKWAVDNSH
ncbi:16S rRNA (cytidine(1402)-2'-O)-methyltransferase [Proteobacteria bacterium 005FR1]|nr:16S rRNA (cytidine(1402)-2'-O)-methyltransferase [Proteobacteria bacterium 005FR1]